VNVDMHVKGVISGKEIGVAGHMLAAGGVV
jgi:hypothetical protein